PPFSTTHLGETFCFPAEFTPLVGGWFRT
ncbi:hypothetical protein LCGC14_3138320, partial [marine sediment metagenome]